jgi:hypothetical protein
MIRLAVEGGSEGPQASPNLLFHPYRSSGVRTKLFFLCSQEDAMLDRALSWIGPAKKPGQDSPEASDLRETTGGEPGDDTGPVCVGIVEGPLRAEIARTYLEQAGISVYLQGEALGSVYGFTSGPLGSVRVLVPAAQAEEAAQIFGELDFTDEDNDE